MSGDHVAAVACSVVLLLAFLAFLFFSGRSSSSLREELDALSERHRVERERLRGRARSRRSKEDAPTPLRGGDCPPPEVIDPRLLPRGACGVRGCKNLRPHSHVADLARRLRRDAS